MKPALQLKFSQQLVMTPQLQQAIKLLQLSSLDLQQEIQSLAESNPLLELDDNLEETAVSDTINDSPPSSEEKRDEWTADDANEQIDREWPKPQTNSAGDSMMDFEQSSQDTLHDHLLWQLNLTPMSDTDRIIALAIIDAIGPNGILTSTPESIHNTLSNDIDIDLDEVEAILHRVQHFDPPGIAALDVPDSLLIQLRQLPEGTPWLEPAKALVKRHLNLLASHDYTGLSRRLRLKETELKAVIDLIQMLNPSPEDQFVDNTAEYVIPDVVVKNYEGTWRVFLNNEVTPKLSINDTYASLIKRGNSSSDNQYLKDQLQEARWFIKSIESRNETLLKVAACIVDVQQDFFERGAEAMKPLILQTIAEGIDMHESTVSRVTTQKYMLTPRGLFELKYFFSSHVGTANGGECSSTAIRAMIKRTITDESPKKPLSDSKLSRLLDEQGINVARRTVAKYRELMGIPPSNQRKRLV